MNGAGTGEHYRRFSRTAQAPVKLEAALEGYLELERAGAVDRPEYQEYKAYLNFRRRPAGELLTEKEDLDGLERFVQNGWIRKEELSGYLELACRKKKRESQLWFLKQIRSPGIAAREERASGSGDPKERETEICREILQLVTDKLQNRYPSFAAAFSRLEWEEIPEPGWGSDGFRLYASRGTILELFREGTGSLGRRYLHTLFHCMYLHVLGKNGMGEYTGLWDIACDAAAGWAVDQMEWSPLTDSRKKQRKVWYREVDPRGNGVGAATWHRWLRTKTPEERLAVREEFREDDHGFWGKYARNPDVSPADREMLVECWKQTAGAVTGQQGEEGRRPGTRKGSRQTGIVLEGKGEGDYRTFLRRFSISREELQMDMESIDYLPYLYGLEHYGNVLLVEPLETTEAHKLEEFVIAIDTSGSCSGIIVQKFLEETYGILSRRENFFRKMQVHLIQCDSMIQDHRILTSEKEWKDCMNHLKIQGLGGTDFTPVFRLVDEMLERKEIRRLKGLLYFTDGDGIYPSRKPPYETAFVFLNRQLEKQKVPDWAWKLNLDLSL